MNSSIAAGAAIPADDAEVVKAMITASNVSGTLARANDLQWQIGVRNDAGVIYRSTVFKSRNQVLRLAMGMGKLGYVNELASAHAGTREGGFDAIFGRASGDAPACAPAPARAPRPASVFSALA